MKSNMFQRSLKMNLIAFQNLVFNLQNPSRDVLHLTSLTLTRVKLKKVPHSPTLTYLIYHWFQNTGTSGK